MSAQKKKKTTKPQPRHVWAINPKTRIKKSKKIYERPREKQKERSWVKEINWFGEGKPTRLCKRRLNSLAQD